MKTGYFFLSLSLSLSLLSLVDVIVSRSLVHSHSIPKHSLPSSIGDHLEYLHVVATLAS